MRRFLTALLILSIVVMAQSVVAITPTPSSGSLQAEILEISSAGTTELSAIGGLPEPLTLVLLLIGISGLAAAGNRAAREQESTRS